MTCDVLSIERVDDSTSIHRPHAEHEKQAKEERCVDATECGLGYTVVLHLCEASLVEEWQLIRQQRYIEWSSVPTTVTTRRSGRRRAGAAAAGAAASERGCGCRAIEL